MFKILRSGPILTLLWGNLLRVAVLVGAPRPAMRAVPKYSCASQPELLPLATVSSSVNYPEY
jgi:hypothetical protein